MKKILHELKASAILSLLFTLIVGFVYPFLIFALSELLFSHNANGSLITNDKKEIIGSTLIGQNFSSERYFHPRPSAAGEGGYDAMHSDGSNLGPTSKKYIDTVTERAKQYREINDIGNDVPIPFDPLTASGSGLDPHISMNNALLQAQRVAKSRSLPINTVIQLVENSIEEPFLGLFGAKRVNVLLLNKNLDQLSSPNK